MMKFKLKFFLVVGAIITLISLVTIVTSYAEVKVAMTQSIDSKINSTEKMALSYINAKYTGEWKIEDNKLLKGDKQINNDFELVDKIKKASGLEVTIFKGDTRVTTTVIKNGKRAVGTKASTEVLEKTLKGGKVYKGETNILNKLYEVEYVPIKNDDGKVIGMFFVGHSKQDIINTTMRLTTVILILIFIVTVISVIVAMIFAKHISAPLEEMSKNLGNIAKGDFTGVVSEKYKNRKDEIGDIAKSIDGMQKELRITIKALKEKFNNVNSHSENLANVSAQMSEAAESVATTIQDVAKGTSSQAEDLVEITNIFEEFGKQIVKIASEIKAVTESTNGINVLANNSGESMFYLDNSIHKIDAAFKEFISKIEMLNTKMKKINDITAAINSIADQTNLLALNAAIEAARAGEQGKGFGVVAEEIRKLSEQVKLSSMDINNVLVELTGHAERIVDDSGKIGNEMVSQTQIVNVAMQAFQNIVLAVGDIIPKVENVNSSTNVIECGKNEILEKVETASAVAEEVSASAEEVSAASEQMNASSEEVTASSQILRDLSKDMFKDVEKFNV